MPSSPTDRNKEDETMSGVSRKKLPLLAAALAFMLPVPSGHAADLFESFGSWHMRAMGEGRERVCWVVSEPTSWNASRKNVRRGDIYLAVTFRPGEDIDGEVNYRAGYPFKEESRVQVAVGDRDLEMLSYQEDAWGQDAAADGRLVEAFKKGATAVLRGESARGTRTTDNFSLIGFTAAFARAKEACSA